MMKSKQLNFYLHPDDTNEIDLYIEQNGLVLLGNPSPNKELIVLPSVSEKKSNFYELKLSKFITTKESLKSIKTRYVESQNHYTIDLMDSPVIEIILSYLKTEENSLFRGRLYYTSDLVQNEKLIQKSDQFLKEAENLFKWFRKKFKNPTIRGYEGFIISKNVLNWMQISNGKLVMN